MHSVPPRVSVPASEPARPVSAVRFDVFYGEPRHALSALTGAVITLFCVGASLAAALFFLQLSDIKGFVETNLIDQAERRLFVKSVAVSGVIACLLPGLWFIKRPTTRGALEIAAFADIISPAMLAFGLPLLFRYDVFVDKELLCVSFATIFGLLLEQTFRRSYRAIARLRLLGPSPVGWGARLPNADRARRSGPQPLLLRVFLVLHGSTSLSVGDAQLRPRDLRQHHVEPLAG